MNKKAAMGISLKQLIGFVLVGIIFFAFIGFFVKLWGIFLNKPTQATINSFDNLIYEIDTLEEGVPRTVPFFIQDGLYLYTECESSYQEHGLKGLTVLNDICICTKSCFKKRYKKYAFKKERIRDVKILGIWPAHKKDQKVRNLEIKLQDKKVTIALAPP